MTGAPSSFRSGKRRREPVFADEWEPAFMPWERPGAARAAPRATVPTTAAPVVSSASTTTALPPAASRRPNVRLPAEAARILRALAADVQREMHDAYADARAIGAGEAALLLLQHHGHAPPSANELERRRLAALRRVLARQASEAA